jgi:hypothetical protein
MTETRQQKRIRQILNEAEEAKDVSLRGHALKRATERDVPRTLTAWEWEQWYAENDKPKAHQSGPKAASRSPWWQRWFSRKRASLPPVKANCVRSASEDEEF